MREKATDGADGADSADSGDGADGGAAGVVGLRERKRLRMYREVSETAIALFLEKGFDAVSVAEVAAAAEISKPLRVVRSQISPGEAGPLTCDART